MKFIQTCQECGHKQEGKDPSTLKTTSEKWRDRKCKKCKSVALDYGSRQPSTEAEIAESLEYWEEWQ